MKFEGDIRLPDIVHENFLEAEDIVHNKSKDKGIEFSNWTKEKAKLKYNCDIPKFPIYNNFIYWCDFGVNIGSEQNKRRPALIIRTENSSTVCTVVPLTSERMDDKMWYHIDLECEKSTALVEQIRTISKIRVISPFRKKGNMISITKNDWKKIDTELKRLYHLRELKED